MSAADGLPLMRLAAAAALAALLVVPARQAARATPFADVPASRWAYQYLQSLQADGLIEGYPDGEFKGDRPLTRYEMAAIVARVSRRCAQIRRSRVTRTSISLRN